MSLSALHRRERGSQQPPPEPAVHRPSGPGRGRALRSPVRLRLWPAVFILDRDGDVTAFQSEADAARFMEAIDVDEGEYDAAFLADGTVLKISIPQGRPGPVSLERNDEHDREALLERIRSYQQANGQPSMSPTSSRSPTASAVPP